ncbi:hypothetical protein [Chryseobacterium gambrini]|uniref:hypothetical protein n=1 Tax=Chryseobacterium gambrini TaxID=373672 RepID=UPI0022F1C278|nr:hypothetical protein [Chryseobacterium gambrini]WBV54168.1 hypothetical protein PFY09_07515 [Chryseobacterium gambrini]
MEKEVNEYYISDYIKGLGIPTIVLNGIEYPDEYRCQTFIIIENPKTGTFNTNFSNIVILKKDFLEESYDLNQFLLDFGLEKTKNDLYYKALELNDYEDISDFQISKHSETSTLMFLKRRSSQMLDYIFQNTISNKLRTLIIFYKNLNFETREI